MPPTPALIDPLFIAFQQAVAGRYSLDREIGRGGMGVVYLAREVHLDRLVAIKLLPPERASDHALRERFVREARLAAKLSHPNIIPIHSVEDHAGFVFFVMAYIDGETLDHRVRTRGPLPSAEGVRVLREVAWALAHAHGQGLVHRDIKPENILIESSSGRVLVADFGIAAVAGDDHADGVTGTPEYMSPEQSLGRPLDARSDLYALGATAWFMFSGRLLFEGATVTELLARHVTEAPPQLATVAAFVPRKLASLVDRCLAKDPEHRPESAQALAEELNAAQEKRRELPAALRAFVKRQSRLNGGGTLIVGSFLLPVSTTAASMFGAQVGYATLALGVTVLPFGYFIAVARKLMTLGFTHADVGPAFLREMEQAREELSVAHNAGMTWLERWLPVSARVAGVAGAGMMAGGLTGVLGRGAIGPGAMTIGVAILAMVGWVALKQRREDLDTAFWSRIWLGRIGRAAFAVAGKLVGARQRTAPVTHRPTEMALGMAAEQLFASLPREMQQSLGNVPDVLRRLQEDARLMRQRHDGLQQALADVRDSAAPEHADLREMRDRVQGKLGESVTALETIRLNLLRLHAGSASVEGLTTHLGMAAELSADVQRLVAAHEEVARTLMAPRPLPTPS
jgi:eukaryotic-like serine/threonine-protein kinase